MASYKQYVFPESLEEAWTLNQKKSSVIIGGNMWLRMCGLRRQTAIDLSKLIPACIEKTEGYVRVSAMTTLRDMETSELLLSEFGPVFAEALRPIVGTQFRNTATVGGSVFSRFGFSDVSAVLLAMNASVVLYRRGEVPLRQFQGEAPYRDILLEIRIPLGQKASVRSVRFNATDFPVLVCAASLSDAGLNVSVGARPARAVLAAENADIVSFDPEAAAKALTFGSNLRAGAEYRRAVAPVLMRRAVEELKGGEGE